MNPQNKQSLKKEYNNACIYSRMSVEQQACMSDTIVLYSNHSQRKEGKLSKSTYANLHEKNNNLCLHIFLLGANMPFT